MATLSNALEGIRVLDLSRLLPGPYLTMILADMGANVVKIEEPGVGDYLRTLPPIHPNGMAGRFLALNRNKRSLSLDLKQEHGRHAFLRMVEQADVVVESFRPGVMNRLGLSYNVLSSRNPRIIMCSISGYGQTGSCANRAGHDLNFMALTGALNGRDGKTPAVPGMQVADIAGGGLWGATGILGALFRRERNSGGAHLDISMTEGVMAMLAADIGKYDCKNGNLHQDLDGGLACYRLYKTRDAKYMSVAAIEPKFWVEFNEALGRKGNLKEIMAPANKQDDIAAQIQEIFQTKTRDEWTKHFENYDCCVEPVLELSEVANQSIYCERSTFFSINGSKGQEPIYQVRTPLGEPKANRVASRLGEHSREVLAEYGFDQANIDKLLSDENEKLSSG